MLKRTLYRFSLFLLMWGGLIGSKAWGQIMLIEKDTSFTLYSAYKKELKNFPFIQMVSNEDSRELEVFLDLTYKEIGQRVLKMDVFHLKTRQKGEKPAILFVHGGGWKSGDKSLDIPLAKSLAAKGYVTAVVEYRLSSEAKYPSALEDIQDALIWLKKNSKDFLLHPDQIFLSGSSAGGQLASLAAAVPIKKEGFSSKPAGLINLDGLLSFNHPDAQEGELAAMWLGGTQDKSPELWAEASALNRLTIESAIPTLLIGSQFPRFLAGKTEYLETLDQWGIYYEYQQIENSPHTFWLFHPWFDEVVESIDKFLIKVLSLIKLEGAG